jgi:hypothetical protein
MFSTVCYGAIDESISRLSEDVYINSAEPFVAQPYDLAVKGLIVNDRLEFGTIVPFR